MNYYMVLDTETANCARDERGQLDVTSAQVYDLGWQIVDAHGRVYDEVSLVNGDVFIKMPEVMKEAYFAEKIPQYWRDIWDGKRRVVDTWQMWRMVREACKEWDVQAIIAHNARFDVRVLNSTIRYQTKSKRRFFLPYGIPIWDTMKMANDTICTLSSYRQFCEENGYMTNHKVPQVRKTAEILWRFLTDNNEFVESHTGLEDVSIEAQIFAECVRRHKAMEREADLDPEDIEVRWVL